MVTTLPTVLKKNGKKRKGKGFSREELKKCGLSFREALRLRVPVDSRRKTAHKENISTLKRILKNKKKKNQHKETRKSKS